MVGDRDPEVDRTVALSYTGTGTRTACREERPQVCGEIRLALAEVRQRTPFGGSAWDPRGLMLKPIDHGTAAGDPLPPPPPTLVQPLCCGSIPPPPPPLLPASHLPNPYSTERAMVGSLPNIRPNSVTPTRCVRPPAPIAPLRLHPSGVPTARLQADDL